MGPKSPRLPREEFLKLRGLGEGDDAQLYRAARARNTAKKLGLDPSIVPDRLTTDQQRELRTRMRTMADSQGAIEAAWEPKPEESWGADGADAEGQEALAKLVVDGYEPTEKQRRMLSCAVPEIFFGGARGGGKSIGVLLAWQLHAKRYGKHAVGVVFRRTLPQLEEIIREARKLFFGQATYSAQKKVFTFRNGAELRLRFLDNDEDAMHYLGHAYTFMAFDELPNWPSPAPIDLLRGCLRSAHGVPCQMISTGNPGGAGHAWVKRRYITPAPPETPFSYAPLEGREDLKTRAVFIPSRLEDNPFLMANDPGYEARLAAAGGKVLFEAWRFGNWDTAAGQYFDCWDQKVLYRPDGLEMQPWWRRWAAVDWGFAHNTAIYWLASDEAGVTWVYRELLANMKTPEEIGDKVVALTGDERLEAVFLSPDAWGRRDSVVTIADMIGERLTRANLPWPTKADNDRIGGWRLVYQGLSGGSLRISRDCPGLIECLPSLVRDPDRPEDVLKVDGDDAADALRYGVKTWASRAQAPANEEIRREYESLGLVVNGEIPDQTNFHIYAAKREAERRVLRFDGRPGRIARARRPR